ncbi:tetratricopeptide repeat protein [Anaerolineales bacterium HSG6]|nr:tetratricopeptide repeat protein [Anaerolineales bacterium HSG6]MDM8530437.1 tetratricopeptide repeat protein [Anaerolineales bacterium HSG25]
MKITIWGARGSIPSPLKPVDIEEKICKAIYGMPPDIDTNDMDSVREHVQELPILMRGTAGGNTSCLQIQAGAETFIIDAGSGIRELGLELMKGPCGRGQGRLHILFSHPHWDHLQGFPFFVPGFIPGNQIFIYSIHNIKQALEEQQRPLNFPVPLSIMRANIKFIQIEVGQPFTLGQVNINTIMNAHPGEAYGFRFEDQHSVFVYASDSEYKHLNHADVQPHIEFFRDADALIFDAQYTLKEAWLKEDWGHSSAMIGVDLARVAGVKKLILSHHDPTYSDAQIQQMQIEAIVYQAQDRTLPTCDVLVAYEGLTIDITPIGAIDLQVSPDGEQTILKPTTAFDEPSAEQLADQLTMIGEQNDVSSSIIDLSQVATLTTASLKLLIERQNQTDLDPIVLAKPSPQVHRIIRLAGYDDYFAIYPSVEEALSALATRQSLNLPGQIIKEQYQIEEKVGQGRVSTVLRAKDIQKNKKVAIKILSAAFSVDTIKRFVQQANQLISLNHDNIVKIFSCEQVDSYTFMAEELLVGPNLYELLSADNNWRAETNLLEVAISLIVILEHAHRHGVIHGELKPENIFFTEQGIKISGFGLGRLAEGYNQFEAPIPYLATTCLSPEQILGHPLDARTDLYAMGVVFYWVFTGEPPFIGGDAEVMQAHLSTPPRPPRELNPDLSPYLEHLILKLLAKNPNDRYTSAQQTHHISNTLVMSSPDSSDSARHSPIVGRNSQLQSLQRYWEKSKEEQGQLVFISGEAGIGKTTLVNQFTGQCNTPVFLIGQCNEQTHRAYSPFIEILQTYFTTVPPEFSNKDSLNLLRYFTPIVPELQRIFPELSFPPILTPKQEQLRLMSNFTKFIKQATKQRPWLIVLENLHWADQNSLEMLRYLSHHLPTMNLLIIGTYRDVELEMGHPLLSTIRTLTNQHYYHQITLPRLDEVSVQQMLGNLWQADIPQPIAEKIYQHTAGNPSYIEEIAKGIVDDNQISWQHGKPHLPDLATLELPQTIRDAVWRRISRLGADTQNLLRQAALLGQTFHFDDLKALTALSEWALLEHLDMALERQLLKELPNSDMQLQFSHAEIQRVLYADIGAVRRRLLHRQVGDILEKRFIDDPALYAETLAHHFNKAGEFERAIDYSLQAAQQAEGNYANETALLWYNNTLLFLKQINPAKKQNYQNQWLTTLQSLGRMLMLSGQYDQAITHYQAAQTWLGIGKGQEISSNQSRRLAYICRKIAESQSKQGDYDDTMIWIERGLGYLQEDQHAIEVAQLYLVGSRVFDHQGNMDEAINWCQKSMDIVSTVNTSEGYQTMARTYTRLGRICFRRGYFDLAIHFSEQSIELHQKIDDHTGQILPYNNMGLTYFEQGKWDLAEEVYQKGLVLAQEVGDIDGRGTITDNLGLLAIHRGELDKAITLFQQHLQLWQQIGLSKNEARTSINMARACILQRAWSDAQQYLQRSQQIMRSLGPNEYILRLLQCWAEYYRHTGDFDQALTNANQALSIAINRGNPLEEGRNRRLLGQIYLAHNEHNLARRALHKSFQLLDDASSQYEVAKTQLVLADWAIKTNVSDEAQQYISKACEVFELLQARLDLEQVAELQKRLRKRN